MTATEAWDEIAAALIPLTDEIVGLQVLGRGYYNSSPTPPSLDVYPATPFVEPAGMGVGSAAVFFMIRARVNAVDEEAGQRLLMRLLDPQDSASVAAVIQDVANVEDTTGFLPDPDPSLIYVEWRVKTFL